ncbi:MAG: trypsin-like peptidase domain-containing protein [Candidatus Brocadiae bacterium]|nr:trypsin-like peptidase domain-containing protein [Candidatus Brocadiia bacterium]
MRQVSVLTSLATGLLLLIVSRPAWCGGKPLSLQQRVAQGKAATALLEAPVQGKAKGTGSAFCVHPAGLFVTNKHLLVGRRLHAKPNCKHMLPDVSEATLILRCNEDDELSVKARVARLSDDFDLALLKVEGEHKPFPVLQLGADTGLVETAEVMAFGFPFGEALAVTKGSYPSISVNAGRITSLRRKDGKLSQIQTDAVINPGNAGGPLIDDQGKVVGVVVSGITGMGVNFAIPASQLQRFLSRPEILVTPPALNRDNQHDLAEFRARAVSTLSPNEKLTLKLTLHAGNEKPRLYDMRLSGGVHRVSAVPVSPRKGPLLLRITATFPDGVVSGVVEDRAFRVGEKATRLSRVRSVAMKPEPEAMSNDGDTFRGAVSGLDAVSITVGGQSHRLNLAGSTKIEVEAPNEIDSVTCTITAWKGNTEVGRLVHPIYIRGVQSNLGLLAFYPFNGNAEDASGNGNHATVEGPTLTTDRFGSEKGAYNFGAPGCIRTPVDVDMSSRSPGVTMTAWVRPTGQRRSFAGYVVSTHGWSIRAGDRYWEVQATDPGRPFRTTAFSIDLNRWQFVAAVFTPGTGVVVYKDDRKTAIGDTKHGRANRDVWIGASPHYGKGNHLFRGKIDDVRIYERALKEAEIQALYQHGMRKRTPLPTPTPVKPDRAEDVMKSAKVVASSRLVAARMNHVAVRLRNGAVLVAGGYNGRDLTSCELYDPASGRWRQVAPLRRARRHHVGVLLPDGRALIVNGNPTSSSRMRSAEIYDPKRGSWQEAAPPPFASSDGQMVTMRNGRVILAGGSMLRDAAVYDPARGNWTPVAKMRRGRKWHRMVALSDGSVLVLGGRSGDGFQKSVERYDPAKDTWREATPMSVTRGHGHSATLLPDGRVLVVGGSDYATGAWQPSRSAEAYDPAADRWTAVANLPKPCSGHTATVVGPGTVVVIGGSEDPQLALFDTKKNTWSAGPRLLHWRRNHTTSKLPDGSLLVAGGYYMISRRNSYPPLTERVVLKPSPGR